jgi:DNA-binding beta-propeller fold protein YncE
MFAIVLVALFVVSCEKTDDTVTPPPTAAGQTIYLINSLGMTISSIDIQKDTIYNTSTTIGKWANQIVYYSGKLYVVSSFLNAVQVFDASTFALASTISLGTGTNPMCIAVLNDQKAYVTCSQTNAVKVINLTTGAVTKTIPTGVGTTGILIYNSKVYVANTAFNSTNFTYGQGTVQVINTTADTVAKTINVATNPQALALDPDNKIHIVCTGDYFSTFGKISVIDPATDTFVKSFDIGGMPGTIAISSSRVGFCGSFGAGVTTYNTATSAIIDSSVAAVNGKDASAIVFDNSGNIFISDFSHDKVYKLNSSKALVRTYATGDGPGSMCIK